MINLNLSSWLQQPIQIKIFQDKGHTRCFSLFWHWQEDFALQLEAQATFYQ